MTFLYGVSRFLFIALASAVVLSLFASYFVAMTVVPLFCAKLIKSPHLVDGARGESDSRVRALHRWFNRRFESLLRQLRSHCESRHCCVRPLTTVGLVGVALLELRCCIRCSVSLISRAPIPASSSSI